MTPPSMLRPLPRGWRGTVVVAVGLAGFVVWVYVVVVLGGGALIGDTDSPSVPLSVLATTVVALGFARVQGALERAATGWGLSSPTPYEVLSQFSEAVTGARAPDELPARMARLLAQGTGAQWAQVWLTVSGRLTLAASWPTDLESEPLPPSLLDDEAVPGPGGLRALAVRHAGESLGMLRLQERNGLALTLVEERLFAGLAAQAGLVLSSLALRAELDEHRLLLLARSQGIMASRERLIETQDAERTRLERDLHDGAQQHLVALTVNLRLAQTVLARSPTRARGILTAQADAADAAIATLVALSRGIYPSRLAAEGLGEALRCAVAGSTPPVLIDTLALTRLPAPVETALYFCCLEAVQNAAKHAGAGHVSVRADQDAQRWRLTITDDGSGFDQALPAATSGMGLANMRDRLDAVGGTLLVVSVEGSGTTVAAAVPRARHAPGPSSSPLPRQTA